MAGRKGITPRCPYCRMHAPLCICSATPSLDLGTRLVMVIHERELSKPTATAILALNSLVHHEVRVYGKKNPQFDLNDLDNPERRLLVLFPDANAATLSPSFLANDDHPVSLLVPDGTWRQVANMRGRVLGLPFAETVKLPPGPPGEWTIRKTKHPDHLSTCEAIARAYGIIESPQVQHQLEAVFRLMVKRIRFTRGQP
jgi:DTW domain-containing protein